MSLIQRRSSIESVISRGPSALLLNQSKIEDDEPPSKMTFKVFAFAQKIDFFLIVIGAILSAAGGVMMPIFFGVFGDLISSIGVGDTDILHYTWMQLELGAASFALCSSSVICYEIAAEHQLRTAKTRFFQKLLRQEYTYFETNDPGRLTAVIAQNTVTFRDGIGIKFAQFFFYMGMFFGGYGVGFYRSWKVTLVISSVVPLLAILIGSLMVFLGNTDAASKAAYKDAGSIAEESFSVIRTVTAFQLQKPLMNRFNDAIYKSYISGRKGALTTGLFMGTFFCTMFCTDALGFWYSGKLVADDMDKYGAETCHTDTDKCFQGGTALAVFFAVIMGAMSVGQAGPALQAFSKAGPAAEAFLEVIERVPEIDGVTDKGYKQTEPVQGEIEIRHLKFAYPMRPTQPVYKDVSIKVNPGESVAIVGGSGCGKSTLVQLLMRYYNPDGGSILFDGHDVQECNVRWLRDQIALVSQEPRLFATSIMENIRKGKEDATDEECIQAAKNANAHNFISQLPSKYDTFVGEGGNQLSGGQKQRVAIARAILRDPKILILDEATSALDMESEKIVQETLDAVVAEKPRTTIIIAHRLSTVRRADRIVVLENTGDGTTVAEIGSHDELIAKRGLYYGLVSTQMESETEEKKEDDVSGFVETFAADVPPKSLSMVRLRSKFSKDLSKDPSKLQLGAGSYDNLGKGPLGPLGSYPAKRPTRKLIRMSCKYPWAMIGGIIGAVVAGLVMPGFAFILSSIIAALFKPTADEIRSEVRKWALVFVGFGAIALVSNLMQHGFLKLVAEKLLRLLRERLFEAILHQDMYFFDYQEHSTGSLGDILSSDALTLSCLVGDNAALIVANFAALVAALVVSFIASWKLALVCVAAFCLLVPSEALQSSIEMSNAKEASADRVDISEDAVDTSPFVLTEALMNIKSVMAFSLEKFFCRRYESTTKSEYNTGVRHGIVVGLSWGLSQFVNFGVQALSFWYGSKLAADGEIDVEKMMKAIMCLMMAAMGIGQAMTFSQDRHKAQAAANRVFGVLERPIYIDSRSSSGMEVSRVDEIRFDNVCFAYPNRPERRIYNGINFSIKAGEVVALVGESGCGKSTAIQLIERFYDVLDDASVDFNSPNSAKNSVKPCPNPGPVRINGKDLRDYNVKSLRGAIGLVGQEPALFSNSIGENIAAGKYGGEASSEEIVEAATLANAKKFVESFPEGFETSVGTMGGQLSGGQKQRIAIARAIIRNPQILILDEATSALDAESEKIVQAALDDLLASQKRTTVVVAHRLSTVRKADKIVVLKTTDMGSVVAEVGNHNELMRIENGIYKRLVDIAEGRT